MDFNDQYKDKRWIDKTKEILSRDYYTCRVCSKGFLELHVHHIYYDRNLKLWEYDDDSLITLCKFCHEKIHGDLKKISGIIAIKILRGDIDIMALLPFAEFSDIYINTGTKRF